MLWNYNADNKCITPLRKVRKDEGATMVQTCAELLRDYQTKRQVFHGEKLTFTGITGVDVYNIAAPIFHEGEWFIPARVEPRETEYSQVMFFREQGKEWALAEDIPPLNLQDPFWTRIGGEIILGGVEVFPHPTIPQALGWRTKFYRGKSLTQLQHFASGPDGMKDIRLAELPNGSIAVFTRPQGEVGGRGTIGYMEISSLGQLTAGSIAQAVLLEQFIPEEWGGANEIHVLKDGKLGVLGHIARFDTEGNRHYYAMAFIFDPESREAGPMEIIATRDDFPPGESKRPNLKDVVFTGGLVRQLDGTAWLYAGLSDAEAGRILIPDPFCPVGGMGSKEI
jgi:hypothetical protein